MLACAMAACGGGDGTGTPNPPPGGGGTTLTPSITRILPASATAGVANGLTLVVEGSNFATGTGGAMIFLNGSALTTTCISSMRCTAIAPASHFSVAGNATVTVQNPGSPPRTSNSVMLVIVPNTTTQDVIPLSAGAPNAGGNNITVVDPTTAGGGTHVNIDALGVASGGSCTGADFPIRVPRGFSGDICLFGDALLPGYQYSISGPGDVSITSVSALGNAVLLTITVSGSAHTGPRTIFVQTPNRDRSAASGALEVR